MVIRNMKSGRRLAVFALFAILAMSAFGFAALNTVPPTQAGDGSNTISGFVVSNVQYNLSNTSIGDINSVSFDLDGPASEVQVTFNGSTTPIACNESGTSITCNLVGEGVTALNASSLRVVAVQ